MPYAQITDLAWKRARSMFTEAQAALPRDKAFLRLTIDHIQIVIAVRNLQSSLSLHWCCDMTQLNDADPRTVRKDLMSRISYIKEQFKWRS